MPALALTLAFRPVAGWRSAPAPRLLRVSDSASPAWRPHDDRRGRPYERHRPERTVLYRIVAEHLESFLDHTRTTYERPLPRYVEREFREYLRCGILAYGFARAECAHCGRELFVAFSCKKRGLCPSCNVRRMHGTAAHVVDRVLPEGVPVRQWVLSTPFELRPLLARSATAFHALMRITAKEIARWLVERAKKDGVAASRAGGISFPQRFGSSLNLNTHIHAIWPDGVFVLPPRSSGSFERASFHPVRAPLTDDLDEICERVQRAMMRWLARKGLLVPDPHASNDRPEESPLESFQRGCLGVGQLTAIAPSSAGRATPTTEPEPPTPPKRSGKHLGSFERFSLHAAVTANNTYGIERLVRYCARPPFAEERITRLPDGRIAYALKRPWREDQTHRVLDPLAFLAHLAALIPPPRHPLVVFHGAFAPHFRERARIVRASSCADSPPPDPMKPACPSPSDEPSKHEQDADASTTRDSVDQGAASITTKESGEAQKADRATPTERSKQLHDAKVDRWTNPWRIDWAALLRRVYDVDPLACSCGGRLTFVDLVLDPAEARAQLRARALDAEPLPIARARSPDLDAPVPDQDHPDDDPVPDDVDFPDEGPAPDSDDGSVPDSDEGPDPPDPLPNDDD